MNRLKGLAMILFWLLGVPVLHTAVGDNDMHWFWVVGRVVGTLVGVFMLVTGKGSPFPDDSHEVKS